MHCCLIPHHLGHPFSAGEILLSLATLSAIPCAIRLFQLSNDASFAHRPGLRRVLKFTAFMECIPVLGLVAALIVKIVNKCLTPNLSAATAKPSTARPQPECLPKEFALFITEYSKLETKAKRELEEEFNKCFPCGGYPGSRETFEANWIKFVFELSEELFSPYKNSNVFILGQSLAWLMTTHQLQESSNNLSPVAFSGDWYGLFNGKGEEVVIDYPGKEKSESNRPGTKLTKATPDLSLRRIATAAPTREQELAYRSYLRQVGLTPLQIIDSEKPFVIMDYIQKGGGLRSFLEILYTWAQEEGIPASKLRPKIHLHLVSHSDYIEAHYPKEGGGKEQHEKYARNIFHDTAGKITYFHIADETTCLGRLFNKSEDERRLIKKLPKSKWVEASQSIGKGERFCSYQLSTFEKGRLILSQILRHKEGLEKIRASKEKSVTEAEDKAKLEVAHS